MRKINKLIGLIILVILTGNVFAQGIIISAKEFATEMKNNKNMLIIDANSPENFAKQHIQGAVNIWHQDLYVKGPIEGILRPAEELAAFFGKKGVSNEALLVIYDDGSQKYNSNLFWIFKFIGKTNIRLLHREMSLFEQARIPMTNSITNPKAAAVSVKDNPWINIKIDEVKRLKEKPGSVLIDVRDPDEFYGKTEKSLGHLPGAIMLTYKDVLNDKGAFKSREQLESLAQKFNLANDKEIVLYCNTGVKAAVVYVALNELLGFQNVKIYEGSYNEWVADTTNPIIK